MTITRLSNVKTIMIHDIVHGVPSLIAESKSDDTIPLPYCNEPISAEADPAILDGTLSSAAAVDAAATIPFMEKKIKIVTTIGAMPPV